MKTFYKALKSFFAMKMTENFRNLFLKLIYNNKKKERGWSRRLREF